MVVVGEKPVLAGGVYSGVVRYYRRRYVGAWVSYVGVFSLCWWRALKAVGRQWRRAINENMHITTGRNSLSVVGERLSGVPGRAIETRGRLTLASYTTRELLTPVTSAAEPFRCPCPMHSHVLAMHVSS